MKRIFSVSVMSLFLCLVILQCSVFAVGKKSTIAVGGETFCAITSSGAVKCWGCNQLGQLGIGIKGGPEKCGQSCAFSSKPKDVLALAGAKAVFVSGNGYNQEYVCAITKTGGAKCWGYNGQYGLLGIGSNSGPEKCVNHSNEGPFSCSTKPLDVKGLASGVIDMSLGDTFACALLSSGTVKCWGENSLGQLGNTAGAVSYGGQTFGSKPSFVPIEVQGLSGVTAITSGVAHSCALLSNGTVKCWGFNSNGELGQGTGIQQNNWSFKPLQVKGIAGATAISATGSHTCALLSGGKVKCWGWVNSLIEEGNCDEMKSVEDEEEASTAKSCVKTSNPVSLKQLGNVSMLANNSANCALTTEGVKCWSAFAPYPMVVEQLGNEKVVELSGSTETACVKLSTGKLKCWGLMWKYDATQDKIINMISGDGMSKSGGLSQITDEGNFTVYDVQNYP